MGMYPCGVIDGKFVVYTPVDFEENVEVKELHETDWETRIKSLEAFEKQVRGFLVLPPI